MEHLEKQEEDADESGYKDFSVHDLICMIQKKINTLIPFISKLELKEIESLQNTLQIYDKHLASLLAESSFCATCKIKMDTYELMITGVQHQLEKQTNYLILKKKGQGYALRYGLSGGPERKAIEDGLVHGDSGNDEG